MSRSLREIDVDLRAASADQTLAREHGCLSEVAETEQRIADLLDERIAAGKDA